MTKGYIRYKSDYKYQLAESYEISISIKPSHNITTDFITLDTQGNLVVKKGYAWDDPFPALGGDGGLGPVRAGQGP